MIDFLQKIIGYNNSVKDFKKERVILPPIKNLIKEWNYKKCRQFNFSLMLLTFISLTIGIQDVYAQCNPVIAIAGNRTTYCVSENMNFGLSVAVTPAQDTFFGNGVIDTNNTDHIAIFNPSLTGPGTFDITYVVQTGGGTCNAGEVATLSITVSPISNAGIDGTASICRETGATIDLFTALTGAPMTTGTWAMDTGSGVLPSGYLGTLDDTQIALVLILLQK